MDGYECLILFNKIHLLYMQGCDPIREEGSVLRSSRRKKKQPEKVPGGDKVNLA